MSSSNSSSSHSSGSRSKSGGRRRAAERSPRSSNSQKQRSGAQSAEERPDLSLSRAEGQRDAHEDDHYYDPVSINRQSNQGSNDEESQAADGKRNEGPNEGESGQENSSASSKNSTWLWRMWTTRSSAVLQNVETQILSHVRTPFKRFNVDISAAFGEEIHIWTIAFNTSAQGTPLVMLHGLGGGIALWVLNFDALAGQRPVYAIDIVGFGRSSRPQFPDAPEECEAKFTGCINEWRRKMNIDVMILMGHSFGGYLATCYAMRYPRHIVHLVLADPWGFLEKPAMISTVSTLPRWARATIKTLPKWNPLWPLRAAGPLGKWIVQKVRSDILEKFDKVSPSLKNLILTYIHQCNIQNPTGESAFQNMMAAFFWAKNPMIHRIHDLSNDVGMTFIMGGKSWIDPMTGTEIQHKRDKSYVEVKMIPDAGHHVYALTPLSFNHHVNAVCNRFDSNMAESPQVAENQ